MSDLSRYAPPPPVADEEEDEFIGPGSSRIGGSYRAQPTVTPADLLNPFKPLTDVTESNGVISHAVAPRYKLGDEWSPQTQSWDPVRIADMQSQLVDAGLLDPDGYQRGYWDEESAQAYRQLLGYSNVSGLESHATLQRINEVKAKYGGGGTGKSRQPFISQLADPAELNELLDDVAVRRMGRGLTPEEKAQFSTSFRGLQESEQRKAYDISGTGGAGGSVTMPDASSRAEQYVTQTRPDDVSSYQYLQAFKSFENLLSRTRR